MSQALTSVTEYLSLIRALFPWLCKLWEPLGWTAQLFLSLSLSVFLAVFVFLPLSPFPPHSFEGILFLWFHSPSAPHDNKWDIKPTRERGVYSNSPLHLPRASQLCSLADGRSQLPLPRRSGLPATNPLPLRTAADQCLVSNMLLFPKGK